MGFYFRSHRLRSSSSQPVHSSARRTLLRLLRNRSNLRQGLAARGFAMLLILLLVLTVLTTTMSLTSRTTSGMAMNSVQGRMRLARDAAENGLVISIGELNKPSNRRLVGAVPLNNWTTGATSLWTTVADNKDARESDAVLRQVQVRAGNVVYPYGCMQFKEETPWTRVYQITQEALDQSLIDPPIDEEHMRHMGNDQYFRVLGIKLTDQGRNPIDRDNGTVADNAVSYLTMTLDGIYSPSGRPTAANPNPTNIAHYTIQQEYQLVPRCCGENRYPVDAGVTASPCVAAGKNTANQPADQQRWTTEWMARSISQASVFQTSQ